MQDLHIIDVVAGAASGGAAFEDFFAGDVKLDVINMKNYKQVCFVVLMEHGAVGTTLITVQACDDVTPSATSAIKFKYKLVNAVDTQGTVTQATSAGFTTAAVADKIYVIEVDANDLPDGYPMVRLSCVEQDDAPVDGSVTAYARIARYGASVSSKA